MRSARNLLLLMLLFTQGVLAQTNVLDHKIFVSRIKTAGDSLYGQVLNIYARHLRAHPEDYKTALERCRFIQTAMYDENEEYNPNYDSALACAEQLLRTYPMNGEVAIYQTEYLYGDSVISYLEKLKLNVLAKDPWIEPWGWQVSEKLAQAYFDQEQWNNAVTEARRAMFANDTLDLSLLAAQCYKNMCEEKSARKSLITNLDSTETAYQLAEKGKLLLSLDRADYAIKAFRWALRDTSAYIDYGAIARSLMQGGQPEQARPFLIKALNRFTWQQTGTKMNLLEYDLKYGTADSARMSYERFAGDAFGNDAYGIYRLRLLWKDPSAPWHFLDIARILFLLFLFAALWLIPYLWILPVYYASQRLVARGSIFTALDHRWGLRHFWWICAIYLWVSVGVNLVLNYPALLHYVNEEIPEPESAAISLFSANVALYFFSGMLVAVLFFLRWREVKIFVRRLPAQRMNILIGIGLAFAIRVGHAIFEALLRQLGLGAEKGLLTINDNILSINQFYHPLLGFLFVVVLVPIYEEIYFRGIMLSATARHMRFWLANLFQAFAFALVHDSPRNIPFYIVFALVAGYARTRTHSIAQGISMHITNNLIAFLFIVFKDSSLG